MFTLTVKTQSANPIPFRETRQKLRKRNIPRQLGQRVRDKTKTRPWDKISFIFATKPGDRWHRRSLTKKRAKFAGPLARRRVESLASIGSNTFAPVTTRVLPCVHWTSISSPHLPHAISYTKRQLTDMGLTKTRLSDEESDISSRRKA